MAKAGHVYLGKQAQAYIEQLQSVDGTSPTDVMNAALAAAVGAQLHVQTKPAKLRGYYAVLPIILIHGMKCAITGKYIDAGEVAYLQISNDTTYNHVICREAVPWIEGKLKLFELPLKP